MLLVQVIWNTYQENITLKVEDGKIYFAMWIFSSYIIC